MQIEKLTHFPSLYLLNLHISAPITCMPAWPAWLYALCPLFSAMFMYRKRILRSEGFWEFPKIDSSMSGRLLLFISLSLFLPRHFLMPWGRERRTRLSSQLSTFRVLRTREEKESLLSQQKILSSLGNAMSDSSKQSQCHNSFGWSLWENLFSCEFKPIF